MDTSDDDLRTIVGEFRASVSAELTQNSRRMDALADELRTRLMTAETAILNSIGDLSRTMDRRMTHLEEEVGAIGPRLDGIDVRLDGIDVRLDGIDGRLVRIDGRLGRIEGQAN